jgi:hypothetical protein
MKIKILWALLGLGACLIIGGGSILVWGQIHPETPLPEVSSSIDIPRYTADQVISVARASCPDTSYRISYWAVSYIGKGKWLINQFGSYSQQYYFYEQTGSLVYALPSPSSLTPEEIARRKLRDMAGLD